MFTMSRDFTFSAAHSLPHLPAEHKCHRVHGHNYVVRVEVCAGELDARGFVIDYADLGSVGRWITDTLDHRNLDEILDGTTAEQVAELIGSAAQAAEATWRSGAHLSAVGVQETPATWVWWSPCSTSETRPHRWSGTP